MLGISKVLAIVGISSVVGVGVYTSTTDCESCPISNAVGSVTSVFSGSSCDSGVATTSVSAGSTCEKSATCETVCPLTAGKAQMMADAAAEPVEAETEQAEVESSTEAVVEEAAELEGTEEISAEVNE